MSDPAAASLNRFLARFSAGDTSAVREAIAPPFFTYVPTADEPNATDIFEQFLTEFRTAAPDLAIEIPGLHRTAGGLLEGTAVVTGTRSGPLWGVPPTGRSHRFEIPVTVREINGRYALNITLAVPQVLTIFRELDLVNPPDQMHLPPRHPTTMPDFIIKVLFDGQVAEKPCQHVDEAKVTRSSATTCDDCGPDEVWPALRMCLTCGHAGCCDTSTHKHARAHFEETGHPMMRSLVRTERWAWCYADNAAFQGRMLDRIEARLAGGR